MIGIGGGTASLQIIITAIDKASGVISKAGNDLAATGAKMKSVGKSMTMGLTLPLVGAGAASIKFAADFDDAMTKSLAIMNTTIEQEKEMERVAREVAKSTTFSHKEAAESYFYLASAGLDANQAIAAMPQVAQFAEAGAFDMALATDLLTDAQSALGLTIRDDAIANMKNMIRVSDTLVKANTLANATVQQFSESLTTRAGAALKMVNKDIEEGVAVLAALADQGIKGAEAGTRLDIVLRDLQTRAIKNEEAFKKYGVTVFDSSGNMRNMADIIGDLEGVLEGKSDAQKRSILMEMEFQDRSVASILALVGQSDAIRNYEKELRNAAGTTEDVANKQLESFASQMKIIKDRLIDAGITIGNILMPYVKDFAEKIVNLIEKFQGLSPTMQKIILIVAGLAAALGPVLMILGMILPALPLLAAAFSPVGLAIAAVIAVIALLVGVFIYAYKHWDEICEGFKIVMQSLKDWIVEKFTAIKNFFSAVWEGIKNIFMAVLDFIKYLFFNWTVPGLIIKHWEDIKDFFGRIWEGIKDIFRGAIDWITDKIDGLLNIVNKVKEIPGTIKEKVGGAVSGVGEKISGGFSKMGDWIYSKLPSWQHGGVVPGVGAQLAVVHGGETIIPRGRGVGDINVYVQGGNYLDREAGKKFAEMLGKMLRRELRY
jgi:TP901 family phage tail tape measure protein